MLQRIAVAILFGAIAWIICIVAGALLASSGIPILETIGSLLQTLCIPIAVIVGLWQFFIGFNVGSRTP